MNERFFFLIYCVEFSSVVTLQPILFYIYIFKHMPILIHILNEWSHTACMKGPTVPSTPNNLS